MRWPIVVDRVHTASCVLCVVSSGLSARIKDSPYKEPNSKRHEHAISSHKQIVSDAVARVGCRLACSLRDPRHASSAIAVRHEQHVPRRHGHHDFALNPRFALVPHPIEQQQAASYILPACSERSGGLPRTSMADRSASRLRTANERSVSPCKSSSFRSPAVR